MEFSIYLKKFSVKKERFNSAGYRARDLPIVGRMLYHLRCGGSTQVDESYLNFLAFSHFIYLWLFSTCNLQINESRVMSD